MRSQSLLDIAKANWLMPKLRDQILFPLEYICTVLFNVSEIFRGSNRRKG